MSRQGSKAAAVFAAILIALQMAACGGDDSSATETSTADSAELVRPGSGARPNAWNNVNEQIRGDILSFGKTGSEAELEEAAVVVRAYLVARANGNSSAACSYLSKYMLDVVEGMAKQRGERGCVNGVDNLATISTADEVEGPVSIDPSSIRRRGKRAFVLYTDRYGDTYAMLMRPEGSTWKIQGFEPTRLS